MRCLPKIVCYLVAPILLVLVLFFPNCIHWSNPPPSISKAKHPETQNTRGDETRRDTRRTNPSTHHQRTNEPATARGERAGGMRGGEMLTASRGAGRPRPRRRRRRRWTWPPRRCRRRRRRRNFPSPSRSSPSPSPTSSTSSPSGASFPSLLQLDLTRPDAIPPPSSPWLGVGARLLGLYDCLWFTKRRIMRVSFLRHRICECRFAI